MAKIIKTYGVINLMEWVAVIRVGKAKFTFPFSGGTLTGYGVTPALYTTDNPVFQKVIEGSNYFKDGKIKLIRSIGDDEATADNAAEGAQPTARLTKVTVPTMDDAREYLKEKYKVALRNIVSQKAVLECAKSHGIEFVIG